MTDLALHEPFFRYPLLANTYSVTDGDTIKVKLDRGWTDTRRTGLRIYGCDAPESRTRKNLLERKAGKLVTLVTKKWIEQQDPSLQIFASSEVRSKYARRTIGRFYFGADATDSSRDLGSFLLEGGFVRPYFGDKRQPWGDEELGLIVALAESYLG